MSATSKRTPLSRTILAVVLFVVLTVGGRGLALSVLIGGYYPLEAFAIDAIGLAAIVALLRGLDWALMRLLRLIVGSSGGRARNAATRLLHVGLLLAIALPFVITLVQLHPQRIACGGTPARAGIPYEDVVLESEGLRLHAWHAPSATTSSPVVLIAHGIGANKDNFLPALEVVHKLGYPALIFDFQAHGDSQGHFATFGFREAHDVKAAYDWLRQEYPGRPVYALGYSMGGAAVLRADAEHGIFDKVVLDATYARAENVAKQTLLRHVPFVREPIWQAARFWMVVLSGLDPDDLRSDELIVEVAAAKPVLLIHGTEDAVIPCEESRRLHAASGERVDLWILRGAGHVEAMHHFRYRRRLERFFGQ